jgi:hypothetical protein
MAYRGKAGLSVLTPMEYLNLLLASGWPSRTCQLQNSPAKQSEHLILQALILETLTVQDEQISVYFYMIFLIPIGKITSF